MKTPLMYRVLPVLCLTAATSPLFCGSVVAQGDGKVAPSPRGKNKNSDREFAANFVRQMHDLSRREPEQAVAQGQQFLAENRDKPEVLRWGAVGIALITARLQRAKPEQALATLDEAITSYAKYPYAYRLASAKSELLLSTGRVAEAEALMHQTWVSLPASDKAGARALLIDYVELLGKQGKHEQSLELMRDYLARTPGQLADSRLAELMVEQLLLNNRLDEAMSWARLNFMVAPYNEKSLQQATQLVVKVWTARHPAPAKIQELSEAMQNPDKPNPLREVALPVWGDGVLEKQLAQARTPDERIALMIAGDDLRGAMVEAQQWMVKAPTSPAPVLGVARVFKAADLNVKRANAFLLYHQSGQGQNPMTEFLQDK